MRIRPAELADMDAIFALNHGYATDHVWQLSNQSSASEQSAVFRLTRLPRQIQVAYPHDERTLRQCLHRSDFVWVMQGDTSLEGSRDVLGYVAMSLLPWHNTGWIVAFAVDPKWRRKGLATQLLRAAIAQARSDGLHSVTLDVQTKNYPATRLCQTRGLRFAGYADNYYSSQDIALFFTYRIR